MQIFLNTLFVGFGGFLGSIFRYGIGVFIKTFSKTNQFPFATFVVNIVGCLLIGFFVGLGERHSLFSPAFRLFLFVGFLGGFTTFSAFGLETISLLQSSKPLLMWMNIFANVLFGLGAVVWGLALSKQI